MRDTRYVGISLTELTDCVEPHAAFCAGQVVSFGEAHKSVLNGGEGRAEPFQLHVDGVDAVCNVHLKGFQKQRPFVTEGVVHALSTDVHDAHQLIGRRGSKALLRKKADGLPKSFLLIELLRSGHAPWPPFDIGFARTNPKNERMFLQLFTYLKFDAIVSRYSSIGKAFLIAIKSLPVLPITVRNLLLFLSASPATIFTISSTLSFMVSCPVAILCWTFSVSAS